MIGETLGNYKLVAKLGSGSMGVVFLAEHQRIARQVAIKLLPPELCASPQVLQRFFNEARATSLIRHPGIVDVFDCDVDATGRAYIVMEHLEGETLGDRLQRTETAALERGVRDRRRRWPRRSAPRTTRGSSTATSSPRTCSSSVMPDPAASVKVLDFGIAKLQAADRARRLTMRGHAAGHAGVHVARAVRGIGGGRPPRRHLCARLHPVRDADRPAAVRRARRSRSWSPLTSFAPPPSLADEAPRRAGVAG